MRSASPPFHSAFNPSTKTKNEQATMSSDRPELPHRSIESFQLEHISRHGTASTTATSSTGSSTWTTGSTATSSSFSTAKDALHKLRHPSSYASTPANSRRTRPRSWHSETVEGGKRKAVEERVKGIHQQNLYTDCGRHSNEWLFSGWGDLARWALGSGGGSVEKGEGERGGSEEEGGRSARRDD